MKILTLLLVFFVLGCNSQTSVFNRVMLSQADGAICLDGSRGSFYISEGSGAKAKSFLIYFQGGELCGKLDLASTLEGCIKMSETDEGSSKKYPQTKTIANHSVLSSDATINPNFHDWTRVLLMHCDGSGHQGSTYLGISYKLKVIHLRGQNITKSMFTALNYTHKIFVDADQIVLAGSAVGGIAALQWANYAKANAKAPVYAIADAAAYMDAININTNRSDFRTSIINTLKICSVDATPPIEECVDDFDDDNYGFWQCMLVQNIAKYLKAPAFIVNSLYDSWSLEQILGIKCLKGTKSLSACSQTEKSSIQNWKQNVTQLFSGLNQTQIKGIWAPACVHASILNTTLAVSQNYRVPEGSQYSIAYSVGQWLKNPSSSITQMDPGSWPSNKACSN